MTRYSRRICGNRITSRIDGLFVNGSARLVGWFSTVIRKFQSGLIYHYAFMMIIGVATLLTLLFIRT